MSRSHLTIRVTDDVLFIVDVINRNDETGSAGISAYFSLTDMDADPNNLPYELRTTYTTSVKVPSKNRADLDTAIEDVSEWMWAVPAAAALESYAMRVFRDTDHMMRFGNLED